MKDTENLLRHMDDLAKNAQKVGVCHSKFLTAAQAATVSQAFACRADVGLCLEGGFAEPERCVAVFREPTWGHYDAEDILAALALRYRKQDTLEHRDILGAILSLGLQREVLGDIVVGEGCSHFVCLASMEPFLLQELHKAARVGLHIQRVPLSSLPSAPVQLRETRVNVASLRLDAVLSAAFSLPRAKALDCIVSGSVFVNHSVCLQPAKALEAGWLVSVRGKGRFRLLAEEGLSRKGRHHILLGFYS